MASVVAAWPMVALGEALTPALRAETVVPDKEYRLLGIRLDGNGPFLRETKLGAQLGATTLFRVASGDFIYSRLFAWRGAFGTINDALDGCYVSGEFPTFQAVPDRLDAEFLRLWFRLPSTLTAVEAECSGSTPLTRNRFKEQFFLAMQIPLPPLDEQRRIVARIEELAARIEQARGLRREAEKDMRQLLVGQYATITADAPLRRMGEVAPLVRRPVEIDVSKDYPELGIRSYGKGTFHKPPLPGALVGTKRLFSIEPGDLLFNIVFAWEGAVAIAQQADAGRFGSHRFLTCVPLPGVTSAAYLHFHFLTQQGLQQLGDASPGGAGRNRTLGLKALENLAVPVPAIEKQLWFEELLHRAEALESAQAQADTELDVLLPSVLDKAFRGEL